MLRPVPALAVFTLCALPHAQQSEAVRNTRAGGQPTPLRSSAERKVDELFGQLRDADVPRFAVEVVERWPQATLERHLRNLDLECRPAGAGPPTAMEMRARSGASIPVHADFLAPLKVLIGLFQPRDPRYFLYRIHLEHRVEFALREGPVSEAARLGAHGAKWEQIGAFPTLAAGRAALQRMERGFETPERENPDDPLPPWVETTCRPPGLE